MGPGLHRLEIQDFSPDWDFTMGGSKVLVTCQEPDGEVSSHGPVCIMFDEEQASSPPSALEHLVHASSWLIWPAGFCRPRDVNPWYSTPSRFSLRRLLARLKLCT